MTIVDFMSNHPYLTFGTLIIGIFIIADTIQSFFERNRPVMCQCDEDECTDQCGCSADD